MARAPNRPQTPSGLRLPAWQRRGGSFTPGSIGFLRPRGKHTSHGPLDARARLPNVKPTYAVIALLVTLALIGAAVAMFANRPMAQGVTLNTSNLLDTPRHPVTNEMQQDADARAGMEAVDFTLTSDEGEKVAISSFWKDKPMVMVMMKDGCPCTIEAQPHFNVLARQFGKDVNFVGVIDADKETASKFRADFTCPFPVLSSPNTDFFKLWRSKQSVYTFFIAKGGKVEMVWPGYNQKMLASLNERLAGVSGKPKAEVMMEIVPEKMTSGCYFFMPVGTQKAAWDD